MKRNFLFTIRKVAEILKLKIRYNKPEQEQEAIIPKYEKMYHLLQERLDGKLTAEELAQRMDILMMGNSEHSQEEKSLR